jgi:hypothetical protein
MGASRCAMGYLGSLSCHTGEHGFTLASRAKLVARPRASTTAAAEDRGRLRGSRA